MTTKIIFKTIEYCNFRSVGNSSIKVNLNTHKTTLVSGKNGAGKSALLSAICFALFGRGYGDINKPALINSINQKKLLVTIEFSIGKKNFKINRGMKPNIFEIYENGKLINQDPSIRDYQKVLEQKILKFNYRAFMQVIAVSGGSEYVPFMKLSAKDRREFIEDLLDIRSFSVMNMLVKDENKISTDELKEVNHSMKLIKEKILLQESFIDKMKKEKRESADKIKTTIQTLQQKNEIYQDEILKLTVEVDSYKDKENSHDEISAKLRDTASQTKQLRGQLTSYKTKRDFYAELTTCPTCTQVVSEDHKASIIMSHDNDTNEIHSTLKKLSEDETELFGLLETFEAELESRDKLQTKISDINKLIFSNNVLIKNANASLSSMAADSENIDAEVNGLKEFAKEFIAYDKKKKELLELQQYHEYIMQILSDSGIKSKIIKQYIPTINRLINKFLGDLDFFCAFYLDEAFNETIKSRHRDTFTYSHFSEGQKRRIDLAILLTWAEIARAKNSVNVNILFLDEIDAPLDAGGSDMLHSLLKSCPSDNIFIISHKADLLSDKCDNSINFELKNNFTVIS